MNKLSKSIKITGLFLLATLLPAGCVKIPDNKAVSSETEESVTEETTAADITEESLTETTVAEAEITSTMTETTTVITEEETTVSTTIIPYAEFDPQNITAPFGDVSDAYICFGGTAVYPCVFVLSQEEVKALAAFMNSLEWEELPEEPRVPKTDGSNDLTMYIYDNGKCSEFNLNYNTYIDENNQKYYNIYTDAEKSERFTLYNIACDLMQQEGNISRISKTHLWQQLDTPRSSVTKQEYWSWIWEDVIPFIEGEESESE